MSRIFRNPAGEQAVLERYRQFLAFWPVPNTQLKIPTRHGETFVVASGREEAPPMILLHGSSSNSSMWMGDVAEWAAKYRVYAIDVIGEPGLSAQARPPLGSGLYGPWIDEVVRGLGVERVTVVGMSLGGWLALDYATKFPRKVEALVLICPAGIGRQKSILHWVAPLLLLGERGRRKIAERIGGKASGEPNAARAAFASFADLIARNFLPRLGRLPIYDDAALKRLTMPVMAILAGRDVLIDSAAARRRLARVLPAAVIRDLPDSAHVIVGQSRPVLDFLQGAAVQSGT